MILAYACGMTANILITIGLLVGMKMIFRD